LISKSKSPPVWIAIKNEVNYGRFVLSNKKYNFFLQCEILVLEICSPVLIKKITETNKGLSFGGRKSKIKLDLPSNFQLFKFIKLI